MTLERLVWGIKCDFRKASVFFFFLQVLSFISMSLVIVLHTAL